MQSLPTRKQLVPVELCPGKDKALLTFWERSGNQFDRIDSIDSDVLLTIRVQVSKVMTPTDLDKHPDHDPKEARELRHQQSPSPQNR